VVFECPLNELMQEIWCEEFMNISPGKTICKWLSVTVSAEHHMKGAKYKYTTTLLLMPNWSHRIPGSHCLMRKSVFACERRWLPGLSRFSGSASHLDSRKWISQCRMNRSMMLTSDTSGRQCMLAKLVLDNQQYMAQGWKWHGRSGHQDIKRLSASSYMALKARKLPPSIGDTIDGRTSGIQASSADVCLLNDHH